MYHCYEDEIEGIAISMPGIIDSKKGYAITGGWLRYIEYIQKNIEKIFAKVPFDIPRVKVVRCKFRNDANLIGGLYNFLQL